MSNAVICGYVRSPFTLANKGELTKVRPDEMASQVVKGLIAKTGVKPEHIEDLLMGCAFPEGEQGLNVARNVVFLAGLPVTVAGATVNRFCGSSMETIHMAAGKIALGAGEVFIAAGVESMSRIPMSGFNPLPHPGLYESYPEAYISMGETAENVAKQFKISRKEQEEFALTSHQKASRADFSGEIIPIHKGTWGARTERPREPSAREAASHGGGQEAGAGDIITKDSCIRADTTLEKMATLDPAFDVKGSVTAATSSPLTDGAVAVLVCSEEYASKHELPILARIKSMATTGLKPEIMGMGPVEAIRKALTRAGLALADIDIIELNEAFAAQALACIGELGLNTSKTNLDGGAIALGHPLGASGGRITGKAAQLLHKSGGRYALSAMCIGGGQGIATILERV